MAKKKAAPKKAKPPADDQAIDRFNGAYYTTPKDPKDAHAMGRLSTEEQFFIRENVDVLSHSDIARAINRTPRTVMNFISKNKLGRTFDKVRGRVKDAVTPGEMKAVLRSRTFYTTLRRQLSPQELTFFEECWVDMMEQFANDVLASEEMELKEMILIEIFKNRELDEEKRRRDRRAEVMLEIDNLNKEDDSYKDDVRPLREELIMLNAGSEKHTSRFQSLCERSEKIRKALYASRQDRVKNVEMSKVDFATWLRELENYATQLKMSREMEIVKAAQEKERKRLSRLHKYANQEVNIPILNEDTVDLLLDVGSSVEQPVDGEVNEQ